MRKRFCEYCGDLLENKCDCPRELEEAREQRIRDYEDRPETQHGWRQQDLIEMHRREW